MELENKTHEPKIMLEKLSKIVFELQYKYSKQCDELHDILRENTKINQQLHSKNLEIEQQIKSLSKRLDIELDNYLPKLINAEQDIHNLNKACELRHAIFIHPEPDKLIDKLKGLN